MGRVVDTNMRRHYQRQWYERQKASNKGYAGYVYGLILEGEESYVGSTTNSLNKRLWQHNAGGISATRGRLIVELIELETVDLGEDLRQKEQEWIDILRPSLNTVCARKRSFVARISKYGATIDGVKYKSLADMHRHLGKVPLGTMKSRLHRGSDVKGALGLSEPVYSPKLPEVWPKYPVWEGSLLSPLERGWWYSSTESSSLKLF